MKFHLATKTHLQAEEEEEEEEDETEEDARDRLSNDLAEIYDNDTNRLSAVSETLDDCLIPHSEVRLLPKCYSFSASRPVTTTKT